MKYMTKTQVADRYGVSPHTVVSWVRAEYIPFLRCGRMLRFDEHALDEWDGMRATAGRARVTPEGLV